MPTRRLTDLVVRSLATDRPQETVWSDRLTGFGVRVSGSTGRKAFVVRYRANGHRRRVTLGGYPDLSLSDARAQARFILAQAARGKDPAGPPEGGEPGFEELMERYLRAEAYPELSETRAAEIERALRKDVVPRIGSLPAGSIEARHVEDVLDAVVARGAPVLANRLRSMISNVFRYALDRGIVDGNPALAADRPAEEDRSGRSRDPLSEDEIRALWRALEAAPPVSGSVLRLRLLTGQRGRSIRHMRKDRISDGWWTVTDGLEGRRRPHRVHLAPQARALLDALAPHSDGSELVLPSPETGGPLTGVGYALARARERLDFAFEPRDLRRTVETWLRRDLEQPPHVVRHVLGSGLRADTVRPDGSTPYDEEKKRAMAAWGNRLEGIVHRLIPDV